MAAGQSFLWLLPRRKTEKFFKKWPPDRQTGYLGGAILSGVAGESFLPEGAGPRSTAATHRDRFFLAERAGYLVPRPARASHKKNGVEEDEKEQDEIYDHLMR